MLPKTRRRVVLFMVDLFEESCIPVSKEYTWFCLQWMLIFHPLGTDRMPPLLSDHSYSEFPQNIVRAMTWFRGKLSLSKKTAVVYLSPPPPFFLPANYDLILLSVPINVTIIFKGIAGISSKELLGVSGAGQVIYPLYELSILVNFAEATCCSALLLWGFHLMGG